MAKFCGNCGMKLDDDAKVCGRCGIPLEGNSPEVPNVKTHNSESIKKTKTVIIIAAAVLAVIAVIVIVISTVTKFTGYNGLIRKVMNAYEDYDIEELISLSSDTYYYEDEDWVEFYFENSVGSDLDYFEDKVGYDYKLSYEVIEANKLSGRKYSEIMDRIEYSFYDFDTDVIDEIVMAEVKVKVKGERKKASEKLSIVMTKEEGKWKLLYLE